MVSFVVIAAGGALAYALYDPAHLVACAVVLGAAFLLGSIVSFSIKVAAPWDRAVVLRLGQFARYEAPAWS